MKMMVRRILRKITIITNNNNNKIDDDTTNELIINMIVKKQAQNIQSSFHLQQINHCIYSYFRRKRKEKKKS